MDINGRGKMGLNLTGHESRKGGSAPAATNVIRPETVPLAVGLWSNWRETLGNFIT